MSEISTATICLAKALHYCNAAAAQFQSVINEGEYKGSAKNFLNMQIHRCKAVLKDVEGDIKSRESLEILRREMADTYRLDAFVHMLMLLNEDGWERAEASLNEILKDTK